MSASKWVRLTAPHLKVPPQLNRAHCTPQQARAGLAESAARCTEMLADALGGGGRVQEFRRDGWAQPWPVGVEMLCYMLSHEAHHRGQVCMLAHQLGFRLPNQVMSGLWNWEKVWKECGAMHSGGPELRFFSNVSGGNSKASVNLNSRAWLVCAVAHIDGLPDTSKRSVTLTG